MFCSKCGCRLQENAEFCTNCGFKIEAIHNNSYENKRKQVYDGEIRKCPNCGEILNSFETKCSACGYELRNIKSSDTLIEFSKKLNGIQNSIEVEEEKKGFFNKVFSNSYGNIDNKTNRMIELIKNYSIPNTKEDILEFMIMASSNIDIDIIKQYDCDTAKMSPNDFSNKKALTNAWIAKMEQAYQKASIALKGDVSFNQIKKVYDDTKKEITTASIKRFLYLPALLVMLVFIISFLFYFAFGQTKKLEKIYNEIQVDIDEERYDEALIKANELRFSRSISAEEADLWDEKRETIIRIINEKKEGK